MALVALRKGAALVALFLALPAFAQEVVEKGNNRLPYQLPDWFVRMAPLELPNMPAEIRQPLKPISLFAGRLKDDKGRYYCWLTIDGRERVSKCDF